MAASKNKKRKIISKEHLNFKEYLKTLIFFLITCYRLTLNMLHLLKIKVT